MKTRPHLLETRSNPHYQWEEQNKNKKAFVSIFAIFFSAIVISVLTSLYVLLIKQIEIMNLDSTSFQSLYMSDSSFECALFYEQNASGTDSTFHPSHSSASGIETKGCAIPGDSNWNSSGDKPVTTAGRAKSVLNISMKSPSGDDFCGVITTDKETRDTSTWTTPPPPNSMIISGQSRACNDPVVKVVERVVEFYY